MNSLSHYTEQKTTDLLNSTGAFFAFSNEQLAKAKQEGVTYVNMGIGLICPKDNAKTLNDGLKAINKEGIAADLAENGKKAIIRRELENYECYFTGDAEDVIAALSDYPITQEEILNELF